MPTVPDVPHEVPVASETTEQIKSVAKRNIEGEAAADPRADERADGIKNEAGLHAYHDAVNDALLDRQVIVTEIKYADESRQKRSHNEDDMNVRLPYENRRRYQGRNCEKYAYR